MTYSPFQALADMPHIVLVWERLVGHVGEYRHHNRTIALDPRMHRRQRRAVLAHELIHAERGDDGTHVKQEAHADKEAARRLVDIHQLGDALRWSENLHEVAVQLSVNVATVETRLAHLHPSERHFLRRVLDSKGETA